METGPPPGGYGLHPRQLKEDAREEHATHAGILRPGGSQSPQRQRSRLWLGLPILGIALVSMRMLFFAHEESTIDFPTYPPPDFPRTVAAAPITLGPLAVDDRSHSYFVKNGALYTQQGDGVPVLHFAGRGDVRDVAVGFRSVFVIDGTGVERISEFGEADTIATGAYQAIALDGSDVIALGKTSIQRLNVAKKSITTIVSADPREEGLAFDAPLAVSNDSVWFGMTGGIGRASKHEEHTVVSEPFHRAVASGLAPSPSGAKTTMMAATTEGILELGGDDSAPRTLLARRGGCHDVVRAGAHLYVTFAEDEGGWAVARIVESGVEPVVHTVIQPRLTARDTVVLWSTPEGVRSASD